MMSLLGRSNPSLLLLLSFFWLVVEVAKAGEEVAFLKEILTGRCYFRSPSGNAGGCPNVVGTFMGVIEGHLDQDITSDSFSRYYQMSDFSSQPDRAIFWPPSNRSDDSFYYPSSASGGDWTTVETTPGGALVDGISFCGVDLRQDCPTYTSHATMAFWQGAYATFASSVQGDVKVILSESAYMEPLLKGGIPNLDISSMTSFSVYADDCDSKQVADVQEAFQNITTDNNKLFSCTNMATLMSLMICEKHPDSPECNCMTEKAQQEEEQRQQSSNNNTSSTGRTRHGTSPYKTLFWILLLLVLGAMYWNYHKKGVIFHNQGTNPSEFYYSEQRPLQQ